MGIHRVARILAASLPRLQVARRPVTIAVAVSVLAGSFQGVPTPSAWRGQVSKSARPLLGDWVLNRDASDDPTPRPLVGDRGNQSRRSRPGGFGISGFGFGRSGRARHGSLDNRQLDPQTVQERLIWPHDVLFRLC